MQKLWLLLQSPSGWASFVSVEASCQLKRACVFGRRGGPGKPIHKNRHSAIVLFVGFCDLRIPRIHYNYPSKVLPVSKPHQAGLKLSLFFWFPVDKQANSPFWQKKKNWSKPQHCLIVVLNAHCWGSTQSLLPYSSYNHSCHSLANTK